MEGGGWRGSRKKCENGRERKNMGLFMALPLLVLCSLAAGQLLSLLHVYEGDHCELIKLAFCPFSK